MPTTNLGPLMVWLVATGTRRPASPADSHDAALVSLLRAYGVARATAYRWVGEWRELAGDEWPAAMSRADLLGLVFLEASRLR